ncbi:MAG: hypothetical protein ACP5U1_11770 [Desulfomonilaceae bacterium]
MRDPKCGWKKESLRFSILAVIAIVLFSQFGSVADAQESWPFDNPLSPVAVFPRLRGEAKLIPTLVSLRNGTVAGDNVSNPSDLAPSYGFTFSGTNSFFLDLMARLQLSRFSVRGYLEQREFAGRETIPNENDRYTNLTYYGIRVGGDVDVFLGNRSRVGFNYDHSFYGPDVTIFNSINLAYNLHQPQSPLKIQGPQSGTIGCHVIYNPVWNWLGTSAMVEAWAHWPIYGTSLSDFEFSGGLKWADTILGSGSIQGGYRWTTISTSDLSPGNGRLDANWGGVFGEVVYYYH